MNFSFLLPVLGAVVGTGFLRYRFPSADSTSPVFVEDEIPLSAVKDDLVYAQNEQVFKVIGFKGQNTAGKRLSELARATAQRSGFFRNISERNVRLRVISHKEPSEVVKKKACDNPVLNELTERWEQAFEKSFTIKHYLIVSGKNEAEIDDVVKECFISLADLSPHLLKRDTGELLTFLSSFYNAREQAISANEKNVYRILRSSIEVNSAGEIRFLNGAQEHTQLVFGIKDFGATATQKIFDALLALPYALTVNIQIAPVEKTKALADLSKRQLQMNLGKREINTLITEEVKALREIVESDKESVFLADFSIFLTLEDKAQRTQAINDVYGVFGQYDVRPVLEETLAMPKFWGQLPGRDDFNRELLLTASNLAEFCPLTVSQTGLSRCDWGDTPVCYFPTAPSGNPFGFTFHATSEDQAPPHCAVFAPTGSGKSVLILHLISQALAAYPDLSVFALDRDDGLSVYTEMVGGTYHRLSMDGYIQLNPFDCAQGDETSLNLFMQILTGAETEAEKKDIRLFVAEMLKQPRLNRRMDAYYAELAPKGLFKEKLEKWVKGKTLDAKLFNGERDTLDMAHNRLNVFGVDNIKEDANAAAAFFFYLFKRIEQNAKSGKPSLLIVDEAPTLLSAPALKEQIEKLLKTARKQRTAVFMAFQGTNDLKELGIKEAVLTNVHTRFFYSGSSSTQEELNGFNLTESETEFVMTAGTKIEGAKRPLLMQRTGSNVFLDTDMSCLGNRLNAFKGGAKAMRFWKYAKLHSDKPVEYYLEHYAEANV